MFEIKAKCGLGRIGKITFQRGIVNTPTLMPVLNPKELTLTIDEMVGLGAEMFITNAYIIRSNELLREKAETKGLHALIGSERPIMTDSGSFQLMRYGKVNVTNEEITAFQELIGSDVGVFQDIPVADSSYEEHKSAVNETLKRAEEHVLLRKSDSILWAGPIQGGRYLDLIANSAQEMSEKPFFLHPIGSVVPLMERYAYNDVLQMILTAKQYLPLSRPVHLFGAGHPMLFALAVYAGCDLFDSASYMLFAKGGRYLTTSGTLRLEKMKFFPCSCSVCLNSTPKTVLQMSISDQIKFLAYHNLAICFQEIRTIKQAILDGRLLNLVLERSMSHPNLREAFNTLLGTVDWIKFIETFEPLTYPRSFLITIPEFINHPLALRYRMRLLERFLPWSTDLYITLQGDPNIPSNPAIQVCYLSPIFGLVPKELEGMFPLFQNFYSSFSFSAIKPYVQTFLSQYKDKFHRIRIGSHVPQQFDFLGERTEKPNIERNTEFKSIIQSKALIEFQFGRGTTISLKNIKGETSRKTDVLRKIYVNKEFFAMVRPRDFTIIPQIPMGRFLLTLPIPRNRVIVDNQAIEFILAGKSVFTKFVTDCDLEIRTGSEVCVVDKDDNLLALGQSQLSAREIIDLRRGIGVKIRKRNRKT